MQEGGKNSKTPCTLPRGEYSTKSITGTLPRGQYSPDGPAVTGGRDEFNLKPETGWCSETQLVTQHSWGRGGGGGD